MNLETNAERTFRRRIMLLSLLHKRPHCYDDIIAALEQAFLLTYDAQEDKVTIKKQQQYQFRNDLRALKLHGYQIAFDRSIQCYTWSNSPFGLSFDTVQLNTLSLLCDIFIHSTFPHADEIRLFLTDLVSLLSKEQQKVVKTQQRTLRINLRETTDYRKVDKKDLKQIEMAIRNGQQLEFQYCAPYTGQVRCHTIEPQPLLLKEGHVYLLGRHIEMNKVLTFRLDNIVESSAKMLSTKNTNNNPFVTSYNLCYKLLPPVARFGVSEHFPEHAVEQHPDGSATITARISDLFEARRIVLSYGYNCIVLDPPELVAQMRQVRDHFNKTYPILPE